MREVIDLLEKLEESLWRPQTRFDLDYMSRVLTPDFFEFGRSGRIYSRQEILDSCDCAHEIHVKFPLKNFAAHRLDENVVLVTYVSEVMYDQLEVANRSSLWLQVSTGWQLVFHQGTAVV